MAEGKVGEETAPQKAGASEESRGCARHYVFGSSLVLSEENADLHYLKEESSR